MNDRKENIVNTSVFHKNDLTINKEKEIIGEGDYVESQSAYEKDPWFYRSVILILGLVIVLCITFSFVLAFVKNYDPPEIFLAVGSAAVGVFTGVFFQNRK